LGSTWRVPDGKINSIFLLKLATVSLPHLSKTLLGVSAELQFLSLSQLHNRDLLRLLAILIVVFITVASSHGQNSRVAGFQVGRRHQPRLFVVALDVEREFNAAFGAEVDANAISAVHHPVDDFIGNQRDQADSMRCKCIEVKANKQFCVGKSDSPMNSSANTVVFDSSCTQSMAIVGVSAMKTLLRLLATLNREIENQNNNRRNQVFCGFYLSSVSSTMNFTLSLDSSVIVTCGWLANGILSVF
jgi:hypothetical protein